MVLPLDRECSLLQENALNTQYSMPISTIVRHCNVTAVHFNRDASLIRVVLLRPFKLYLLSPAVGPVVVTVCRRIWNTTTGQCLKTLAKGHDAVWYAPSSLLVTLIDPAQPQVPANTSSFLPIRNTFCPLPTTARSGCGTITLCVASRHTLAIATRNIASLPVSVSQEENGLSWVVRIIRCTFGICRLEKLHRYCMGIQVRL